MIIYAVNIKRPIHLYLIFEKSSWKNQVRRTGFLVYFKLDFYSLCSLQKSISKLIFAGYTGSKNPVRRTWFFQLNFSKIKCRWIGRKREKNWSPSPFNWAQFCNFYVVPYMIKVIKIAKFIFLMDTRRQFSAGREIPLISGFTVIETTNPRRG